MKNRKQVTVNSKKKTKKDFNIKEYLRDFLLFVDKNLIKTIGILFVISIVLIIVILSFGVPLVIEEDCAGTCRDSIKLLPEYGSTLAELFVTVLTGTLPYMYIPAIGFVGLVLAEASTVAYAIKGYGYFGGIAASIFPLILNLVVICIVSATGIYICKAITVGNRLYNAKNTNWIDVKIKLYEGLKKKEKAKSLKKKREDKIKNLEAKNEKINYLQILNIAIVVCIIQFISVLIQHIVL